MGRPFNTARLEAIKRGETTYVSIKPCKNGHNAPRFVKNHACTICCKLYSTAWNKAHPERLRASGKLQYLKYPEKTNARYAKRRASKKQATPAWLNEGDLFFMQEAYALAKQREKVFGFRWEVDHIIPLRNKFVCGLHTPNNLRVVPHTVNRSKGNKFDIEI